MSHMNKIFRNKWFKHATNRPSENFKFSVEPRVISEVKKFNGTVNDTLIMKATECNLYLGNQHHEVRSLEF